MPTPENGIRNELKNLARRIERIEAEWELLRQSVQQQTTAQQVLRNDVRWIVKVAMAAASAISLLIALAFQLTPLLFS